MYYDKLREWNFDFLQIFYSLIEWILCILRNISISRREPIHYSLLSLSRNNYFQNDISHFSPIYKVQVGWGSFVFRGFGFGALGMSHFYRRCV